MTTNTLPGFDDAITPEQPTGIMPKRRWRFQFKFWLDANSHRDKPIGEFLEAEKSRRKMTATIRDGVRLIQSLRNRDTSVLLELFPWLVTEFQPETPGDGMNALLQKIAADTEQLVAGATSPAPAIAIEAPPQARSAHNPPIATPESAASPVIVAPETLTASLSDATPVPRVSGPTLLQGASRPLPGPIIDDDDEGATLVLKPIQDRQSGRAFLASVTALVSP